MSAPSNRRPSARRCSPSRNRSGRWGAALRRDRADVVVGQQLAHRCDLDPADLLGRQLRRRRELAERARSRRPSTRGARDAARCRGTRRRRRPGRRTLPDARPRPPGRSRAPRAAPRAHPAPARRPRPAAPERRAQRRRHRLHRGEVRRDDDERTVGDAEAADRVGPPGRDLGRRIHPLVRQRVPRREERDALRAQVGADLGCQFLGFARTGGDHEQRRVQRHRHPGEDGVLPGVDLGHDRAGALQQQPLERRGADERIEHLPERHPTSPNANATTRTAPVAVATGHPRGDSRRRGAFRGPWIARRRAVSALSTGHLPVATASARTSSRFERLGDVEALRLVASEVAEPIERVAILDALGDDPETEVLPELDSRPDDREVLDAVEHVGDERAVDLDLLDRQPLQVGERGESRPEVVDRETHPDLGQAVQDGVGAPRVGDEEVLGQLEPEERRRHPPPVEEPARPRGSPGRAASSGRR